MLPQDGLAAAASRDARKARGMAHASAEKKKRKAHESTSALRAKLELSNIPANSKFHVCGLLAAEVAAQCRRAIEKIAWRSRQTPRKLYSMWLTIRLHQSHSSLRCWHACKEVTW